MSSYLPPPTYADVILLEPGQPPKFNPIWLDWFVRLTASLGAGGSSDHNMLTDLQGGTANQYYHLTAAQAALAAAYAHNSLNGLQGGGATERYHLTAAEHTAVLALLGITGISTVITTAKLTGGGTNGSMTFVSGLLTVSTPAT